MKFGYFVTRVEFGAQPHWRVTVQVRPLDETAQDEALVINITMPIGTPKPGESFDQSVQPALLSVQQLLPEKALSTWVRDQAQQTLVPLQQPHLPPGALQQWHRRFDPDWEEPNHPER